MFRKRRSPAELASRTVEALRTLKETEDVESKAVKKAHETLEKDMNAIKSILLGDAENEPSPELTTQLANEVYTKDIIETLLKSLPIVSFEVRKDTALVFNSLLRRQIGGTRWPTLDYLHNHIELLTVLVDGYENGEITLNCGLMLRECVRHETLAKYVLTSGEVYRFFRYVDLSNFDIASDAFATFKDLLTIHKVVVAEFLENSFDEFFERYNELLLSSNYVTRRQSLKLLGDLLLDRANFRVMTRYIAITDNLKLMMNMLRDKSKNIQFEAFHVFKVFAANPKKPDPIKRILLLNKEKLVSYLQGFLNEKNDDEQFVEEKELLVREISKLE